MYGQKQQTLANSLLLLKSEYKRCALVSYRTIRSIKYTYSLSLSHTHTDTQQKEQCNRIGHTALQFYWLLMSCIFCDMFFPFFCLARLFLLQRVFVLFWITSNRFTKLIWCTFQFFVCMHVTGVVRFASITIRFHRIKNLQNSFTLVLCVRECVGIGAHTKYSRTGCSGIKINDQHWYHFFIGQTFILAFRFYFSAAAASFSQSKNATENKQTNKLNRQTNIRAEKKHPDGSVLF